MSSAEPPPGGDDPAPHRHFCPHCSTTDVITTDPFSSFGSIDHECPICHGGGFIQLSDILGPSSTPPTPAAVVARRATFEIRHPADTFVRVISESNFFRDPLADSAPILSPLPAVGSIIPFHSFSEFLDYCFIEGAMINSTLRHDQFLRNYFSSHLPSSAPRCDVALLPVVSMVEDLVLASGDARCPVCLEDFEIGEVAKQLPCKHLYHRDCIAPWLQDKDTCPVCRLKLATPPMASGVSRGQNFVTRFDVELQWQVESSFSRLETNVSEDGGGGEGNGEGTVGNEPSAPESGLGQGLFVGFI